MDKGKTMNTLPSCLKKQLSNPCYQRQDKNVVDDALNQLGVSVSDTFKEFYNTYSGTFISKVTSLELLEIMFDDDSTSILTQTIVCREEYDFPNKYLVISSFVSSAYVYNCDNDAVYNVDFEGGDELLVQDELEPEWNTFYEFLEYYFSS